MALFKVENIIDGDTITVSGWQWGEYRGKTVKVEGYNIRNDQQREFAKNKLEILLKGNSVELKGVKKAEFSEPKGDDKIFCFVFLNDINIAQYFPELTAV